MAQDADRPLRVMIGMPFGSRQGGAERLLDDLLERSDRLGLAPHVVFLQEGPWPDHLQAAGIRVTVLDPGRFRDLRGNARAIAALRALMIETEPDVVVSWIARAHVLLAPAAVAAGLRSRLVWFQHQVEILAVERVVTLLPAALVLACSEAAAGSQRGLWPSRRVRVVRPGIALPELLTSEERSALRRELRIPSGAVVIGISGRLVRWKGQDRVLRALALLRERGLDAHGLILGGEGHGLDLGYGTELEVLSRSLGIGPHVTFTGHREDARAVTQVMDIAVNASETEPFGLTVLEALAVGVPVVAVNSGGPKEIIEPDRTGILVDAPTAELLAEGLAPLVSDPDRRQRLGEAGRQAVLRDFRVERFAGEVRDAFDDVAAAGRRRSV